MAKRTILVDQLAGAFGTMFEFIRSAGAYIHASNHIPIVSIRNDAFFDFYITLLVSALHVHITVVQVTTYLHPAAIVLKAIWEEYYKIQVNKAKLGDLLDRCKRVIGAIDQELSRRPSLDVKKSIDQLIRHLQFIEQLMRNLAELGFFKSLLQRDDISDRIVKGHQWLTDCLTIFQITAAADLREYQESLNRARIADQDTLTTQLRVLENNGDEVLKQFNVFQNQMEAMMAIQNVRES
ncbi:hypothetical protein FRB93_003654 [Tulasnella sp. JGI-2019a]|nr:hypothetical protein FRB93_003654 [Tulasnella sp. JGI-2019a]